MTCDNPELVAKLADVLRNVAGNVLDEETRLAAYFRVHPELISENAVVLRVADQSALASELLLRVAGYQ